MKYSTHIENPDVILIGSGVMSAHLGTLLKQLDPRLSIQVYEVTEDLAQESSDGWNNAGTGHAGICELSYTPKRNAGGSVDVSKAFEIFEQFEQSKEFWGFAVASGMIGNPRDFINPVPHVSFVHGEEMVDFLRDRRQAMSRHHFFRRMEYTTDRDTIAAWAPLLVEGRGPGPIAATRMEGGTDVNFGALSRMLFSWLHSQEHCGIASSHRVIGLRKEPKGWKLRIRDLATGEIRVNRARFVFVGAGGGSLPLLQKARLPEAAGLGGFPIGGQWLVCDKPEVVTRHCAKVYGQPLPEAPTMAVPHLDTRIIEGQRKLLFGPFAAWTSKFLNKKGSITDLPFSIRPDNIFTLLNVGAHNLDLVRYLVRQGTQSKQQRMDLLHTFYPTARAEDWSLAEAGIRVQAIKKTDGKAGIVHYGTEVLTDSTRTISALLGASPGASVCTNIAIEVIRSCMPQLLISPKGRGRLKEMIPCFEEDIKSPANSELFQECSAKADEVLGLT